MRNGELWKLNERIRKGRHPEKAHPKLCSSSQQEKSKASKDTIPFIDNLIDFLKVLFFLFLARLSHRLIGNYSATFAICLAFFKLVFYFFRDIFSLSKEKSTKFNWFILLCECVDSRIGPITNASLVFHACSWGQRYHVTRFSRWQTTLSVIQIPAGKNVEMKAGLILYRKLKGWGQILLPLKKLKYSTYPLIRTCI